jgi:hypothetical protein
MDTHKGINGGGGESDAQENGVNGGVVKRWLMVVRHRLVVRVFAIQGYAMRHGRMDKNRMAQ